MMFVKFHVCQSVRFLFLMWTTLNIKAPLILRLGRKWKGLAGDNYKRTLNIEFEQDWSVGLGATLGADRKLKNIFLVRRIFPGKADNAIFLGFECTIKLQNLMKSLEQFLRKSKFLIFFLCELPLILRVDRKRKNGLGDICKETQDVECERDWSVGLGATLSNV